MQECGHRNRGNEREARKIMIRGKETEKKEKRILTIISIRLRGQQKRICLIIFDFYLHGKLFLIPYVKQILLVQK